MTSIAVFLAYAATAAPFTFKGGSLNDFVNAIAQQKHVPVVALASSPEKIQKFEIDATLAADPKDFSRLMHARSGYYAEGDGGLGVFKGTLSWEGQMPWKYEVDPKNPEPRLDAIPADAVEDSKVALTSSGEGAFVVGGLTKLNWSKPLSVYWSLQCYRFVANVRGCTESKFLSALASAIGASFREDAAGYVLDLDENKWRSLAIKTEQNRLADSLSHPSKPYSVAGNHVAIETYRQVTNAQIRMAFDSKVGMLIKEMNPAVRSAVAAKTRALRRVYEDGKKFGGLDETESTRLGLIDWSLEPYGVTLQPALGVPVAYHSIDGGTVPH